MLMFQCPMLLHTQELEAAAMAAMADEHERRQQASAGLQLLSDEQLNGLRFLRESLLGARPTAVDEAGPVALVMLRSACFSAAEEGVVRSLELNADGSGFETRLLQV